MSSLTNYGSQSKTLTGIVSLNSDTLQVGTVVVSGSTISGVGTVSASNMNVSNVTSTAATITTLTGSDISLSGNLTANLITGSSLAVTGNITQSSGTANLQAVSANTLTTSNLNGYNPTTELTKLSNNTIANINESTITGALIITDSALTVPTFPGGSNTYGAFTVSSSSDTSSLYLPYSAVKSSSSNSTWISAQGNYPSSGGVYTGSTVTGGTYYGEWWQMACTYLFSLTTVQITNSAYQFSTNCKTFYVLGSTDLSTWVLLGTGSWTTAVNITNPTYRMYYVRIVVNETSLQGVATNCFIPHLVFTGRTAEGTLSVKGNGTFQGNVSITKDITISGNTSISGNATLIGSQAFGSNLGNKLFLFSTSYGLGISSSQQNYWTGGSHVFYYGGSNNSGSEKLRISNTAVTVTGNMTTTGNVTCNSNFLGTTGDTLGPYSLSGLWYKEITGIPSWATEITVIMTYISNSAGTGIAYLLLGNSDGTYSSSYQGASFGSSSSALDSTYAHISPDTSWSTSVTYHGQMIFKYGGVTALAEPKLIWGYTGIMTRADSGSWWQASNGGIAFVKSTTYVDRVKITHPSSTTPFDTNAYITVSYR